MRLSTEGLKNINRKYLLPFLFELDKVDYGVDVVTAEFISPLVAKSRAENKSFRHYVIDVYTDKTNRALLKSTFEKIISMGQGKEAKFEKVEMPVALSIARSLGNVELVEYCIGNMNLDPNNVCSFLKYSQGETIVEYAAENFYRIPRDHILDMQFKTLDLVLNNKKLTVKSEDYLFNFLKEYGNVKLLNHVQIALLSQATKTEFCQYVEDNALSQELWSSISSFISNKCLPRKRLIIQEALANNSEVKLNASSRGKGYKIESLLDPSTSTQFCTDNKEGQWVSYEFSQKVYLDSYTLTPSGISNTPISWDIAGSNDGENWEIIDSQRDSKAFPQNQFPTVVFSLPKAAGPFKYLKMKMVGCGTNGPGEYDNGYYLGIRYLDFIYSGPSSFNKTVK